MKVTFEFPDNTKAVVISYIVEDFRGMCLNLRNISTAELASGNPIKVRLGVTDPEE